MDFIPLIFASDINVYSVARAFNEEYGVVSRAIGKADSGPCYYSSIIDYSADDKADDVNHLPELVNEVAEKHPDKQVILIGCGDSYVRAIAMNKEKYRSNVVVPYADIDLIDRLIDKESFATLCTEMGIDTPDTFVYTSDMGIDFDIPFDPPYIIKPANGIEYWKHPFWNQAKVYKAYTQKDLQYIFGRIFNAGYDDALIIQNFIPGDDTFMRVVTCYSDRNGRVKLTCTGHVLLEEHTSKGIGNHALIITEQLPELEAKLENLLESVGFVGFSNFDVKYDMRDGKYKVFELNARQGRSNYYVTGAGENIARYLVEDFINENPLEKVTVSTESLWTVVPMDIPKIYITQENYKADIHRLVKEGKHVNPLYNPKDKGLRQRVTILRNQLGHYKKFSTDYNLKNRKKLFKGAPKGALEQNGVK